MKELRVNPLKCTAYGMCAEILPERITLDDWGYPILDGKPIPDELLALAKQAVAACPKAALMLQEKSQ